MEKITKNERISVISYGLGPIGIEVARTVLDNPRLKIVAAIDIAPDKAGRDLGYLVGLNRKIGIRVSANADEVLSDVKADVVLLATGSLFEKIYPQIQSIICKGINCISSSEELFFPYSLNFSLAQQLDEVAREHGVTAIGIGVNPGFLMDTLPLFFTSVCQSIRSIYIERIVDVATRRLPLQKKVGVALTPEEFREKTKGKRIGHVGLAESLNYLARNLDWQLYDIQETIYPIIAKKGLSTQYFSIKKNQVCGTKQTIKGIDRNGNELTNLDLQMYVGAKNPHDLIIIKGKPNLRICIEGGIAGGTATAAIMVNSIPLVIGARSGLITTKDLPLLRKFV